VVISYNRRVKVFKKIKDFLVPHSGNDYQPHSLQKAAVLGMMLLVIISFTVANLQALLWISSDWMVSTILPAVIVTETNDERSESKLRPLLRSQTLDEAAQLKADDMAKNSYFSHDSPEGVTPWHWFDEVAYNYVYAGENLAVHFTDSSEVVQAWMDSPTHRANIMNGNYQEIGIGTAKGKYEGFDTVFVVQLFGTQAAVATPSVTQTTLAPEATVAIVDQSATVSQPTVAGVTDDLALNEQVTESRSTNGSYSSLKSKDKSDLKDESEQNADVPLPDEVVVVAVATATTTEEVKEEINTTVTDEGIVVYSSYISTSTGGIPASVEEISHYNAGGTSSVILSVATKPNLVLQVAYLIIGGFVLLALLLSIFIEIRRQHPVQIAYGLGLVTIMILLFNLHLTLSQGVLII
jgi:hypothetical protein